MNIQSYWKTRGYNLLIWASILAIFIAWFMNRNGYGTYDEYSIDDMYIKSANHQKNTKDPHKNSQSELVNQPTKMSKGEIACRQYLEQRFKKPFPSCRPDFMFNSVTGENLELDMFNKELMLACEYNGKQHYEYNPFMHRNSKQNFRNQQYRDHMKQEICKKLGIKLITVPYTVHIDDIPVYIENTLITLKL